MTDPTVRTREVWGRTAEVRREGHRESGEDRGGANKVMPSVSLERCGPPSLPRRKVWRRVVE